MNRFPTKAHAGFTLVELLVGMALSAAVLLAVLSSYLFLGRGLVRLVNQQNLETESRRTLAHFTEDVRKAVDIDTTVALSASRVALVLPTASGTNVVTYYYNSTSGSTSVTVNGTSVSMTANSLTRCLYNGSTVTSVTLLKNIVPGGLTLRYFDSAGNEYSSYTDYLPGIKQLAIEFGTQSGIADSGTLTPITRGSSSRLALRNRAILQ